MPKISKLYEILKKRVYNYRDKYPLECANSVSSITSTKTQSSIGHDDLIILLTSKWKICIKLDHFDGAIYLGFIKSDKFISRYSLSYATFYHSVIEKQRSVIEFSWIVNSAAINTQSFPTTELLNILKNILKIVYSKKHDTFKIVNPFKRREKP